MFCLSLLEIDLEPKSSELKMGVTVRAKYGDKVLKPYQDLQWIKKRYTAIARHLS
ncbi:MAG: hypothetical protein PHN61_03245 [Methanothrix sp.]|nr:hypothetical protein [Methanothrix sp.]